MNTHSMKTAFHRPMPRTSSGINPPTYTSTTPTARYATPTAASRRSSAADPPKQTFVYEKNKEGTAIIKKFLVGNLLGKGGFAKVYEFTDVSSGHLCAAKVIDRNSLKKEKTKQKLLTEIKIHKSLNHKNIVKFEHFFSDENNVYILLEVCHCQVRESYSLCCPFFLLTIQFLVTDLSIPLVINGSYEESKAIE